MATDTLKHRTPNNSKICAYIFCFCAKSSMLLSPLRLLLSTVWSLCSGPPYKLPWRSFNIEMRPMSPFRLACLRRSQENFENSYLTERILILCPRVRFQPHISIQLACKNSNNACAWEIVSTETAGEAKNSEWSTSKGITTSLSMFEISLSRSVFSCCNKKQAWFIWWSEELTHYYSI